MPAPVADDAPLLDGRYRLLECIGSGGMGAVHRAHDEVLDRIVAIKVLHAQDGVDHEVGRGRLQAEARFAGALRHPRIVSVYDYGEERQGPRVLPYVVMQHVPGRPLSAVLRESGPLPPDRVARLVAEIADALSTAHAAGIVHRDLKPSNILLTEAGDPVIVDFGIARSDDTDPLTRTGEIIGTAAYLSPEQVRGQRATAASDVYALGVIAYQCLSGASPFRRETHIATALAHLNDRPPPLPATVPRALRALVDDMLRDDPRQRPDARAVTRRARGDDAETGSLPVPTAPGRRPRWPRPVAIACAAAVLLAGGVVAAVALDGDPATSPAAADLAVPSVRGDQVRAARAELEAAGFDVAVRRVPGGRAAGLVLAQRPASGPYDGELPATVALTVASGPEASATPSPTPTAEPVAAPAAHPRAKPKGPKPKPHAGHPQGPGKGKGPAKKHGKGHGEGHGKGHHH